MRGEFMLMQTLKRFASDQSGATAIEYALLATLIGIALVATFTMVGDSVANMFGSGSSGATGTIDGAAGRL
jgi:pilus assembly protein Flp/PilA